MPKFSVITISFNSEKNIEKTVQSIINQTFKDFEYIFVDGNSKDKTLEIAGKYKSNISKWISEPNKSIYDGMNKGILLAQGEYIIFLNAGDTLASNDVLEKFSKQLENKDIICGNLDFGNLDKPNIKKQNYSCKISLCAGKVFHQAEFFKRELLEQLGGFDTRFRILASHELTLRAVLKNNATVKYIDETISALPKENYFITNPKEIKRQRKEMKYMQNMYFPTFIIWLYTFLFKIKN